MRGFYALFHRLLVKLGRFVSIRIHEQPLSNGLTRSMVLSRSSDFFLLNIAFCFLIRKRLQAVQATMLKNPATAASQKTRPLRMSTDAAFDASVTSPVSARSAMSARRAKPDRTDESDDDILEVVAQPLQSNAMSNFFSSLQNAPARKASVDGLASSHFLHLLSFCCLCWVSFFFSFGCLRSPHPFFDPLFFFLELLV